MKLASRLMTGAMLVALLPAVCSAQILFQDQLNDGTNWGENSSGLTAEEFNFDYSAVGIPEAPNSQGGDDATRGVRLTANFNPANETSSFVSLFPTDSGGTPLNFTGSYQLRFDTWINFGIGGAGTTEFIGGGIAYDNVTADIASGAQIIVTGDGGSSNDWRTFKSPTAPQQFFIQDAEMAGGTHQGSDPYYADFLPAVAPPASQGQAAGDSVAGSPGFQWITLEVNVNGNDITMFAERPDSSRLLIVEFDKTFTDAAADPPDPGLANSDGNISLFYADFFSGAASLGALQFGLIDNVVVNRIPEPASAVMLVMVMGLAALRRRRPLS